MNFLVGYIRFSLRFSRILFCLAVVVVIVAAWLAWRVRFEFSLERLFLSDSEELTTYRDFSGIFGADDNVVFVAYKTPDAFEPSDLAAVGALCDRLRGIEGVRTVFGLPSAVEFANRLSREVRLPGAYDAGLLRRDLTSSPVAQHVLTSSDGRASCLFVELGDLPDVQGERTLAAVREALREATDETGVHYYVAGIPLIEGEYSRLIRRDTFTLLPVSILIILFLLALYFRNIAGTVVLMGAVFASVVCTIALLSALKIPISVLTSMVPTLILVVGISDGIHVLSHYNEEMHVRETSRDAVAWTIVYMAGACFLTTVANSLGFGTMVVSPLFIMREFGFTTTAGLLLAFVASIVLLPAMLDVIPATRLKVRFGEQVAGFVSKRLIDAVGWVNERARLPVYGFILVLVAACGYGMTRIQIRSHWLQDMHPESDLHKAHQFIDRNLSSIFSAEFWVKADSVRDLETVRAIDRFETAIREDGEYSGRISYTFSIADLLREANAFRAREQHVYRRFGAQLLMPTPDLAACVREEMAGFDLAAHRSLPEDQVQLDAAAAFLEQRARDHDILPRFVDADWKNTRVMVRMDMDSKVLGRFVEHALAVAAQEPRLGAVAATGKSYMAKSVLDRTIGSTLGATALLAAVLFTIFAVIFRSVKVGLMAMAPNLIPPAITAGFMGLTGMDLNYSTVTIFGITLGLTVENTIQYLLRYRLEVLKDQDYVKAMYRALEGAGKPTVFSNVLLIAGFGCVVLSSFKLTQTFGLLGVISISGATLAALFVTPSLPLVFKPEIAKWTFVEERLTKLRDALAARFGIKAG